MKYQFVRRCFYKYILSGIDIHIEQEMKSTLGPTFMNLGYFPSPSSLLMRGKLLLCEICKYLFKALRLFFLPNFPDPVFIPSIPEFGILTLCYYIRFYLSFGTSYRLCSMKLF